jgi:hypothetical protein
VEPHPTQIAPPATDDPPAERWALWAAEVPPAPDGLLRARARLAEALVAAGWGADAGRVLLVAGDALTRALGARRDAAGPIDVAFLVGPCSAGLRIAGPGCATAYEPLVDRIEHRPARDGARVLMSFRREGVTRPAPRRPR